MTACMIRMRIIDMEIDAPAARPRIIQSGIHSN
jgi:hypothetical protein